MMVLQYSNRDVGEGSGQSIYAPLWGPDVEQGYGTWTLPPGKPANLDKFAGAGTWAIFQWVQDSGS